MNNSTTQITVQQGGFKSSPNGIDGSETPALPIELISRYKKIYNTCNNPYYSKKDEQISIIIKAKELRNLIKKQQN